MDPSSEIGVVAVRVSRLDADGTPDFNNAIGAFMLCGGLSSFEYDFDNDEGEDVFVKDAGGLACVNFKRQDIMKRVTFTLTLCRSDVRLEEILLGANAEILTELGDPAGIVYKAASACGTPIVNNGVAIELWSERIDCNAPDADFPYARYVMPRAYLTPAAGTLDESVREHQYVGYGVVNNNFDDGPFGDLDQLVGVTNWPIGKVFDTAVPTCPVPIGYIPTPSPVS